MYDDNAHPSTFYSLPIYGNFTAVFYVSYLWVLLGPFLSCCNIKVMTLTSNWMLSESIILLGSIPTTNPTSLKYVTPQGHTCKEQPITILKLWKLTTSLFIFMFKLSIWTTNIVCLVSNFTDKNNACSGVVKIRIKHEYCVSRCH